MDTYICTTCGNALKRKTSLRQHEVRHTGDGKHKCSDCSLVFFSRSNYNRHMQIHTQKKEEACPTCTSSFILARICSVTSAEKRRSWGTNATCVSWSSKLLMTMHTGEKKYFCPVCNKNFRFLSNWTRHRKTHQSTSYACHLCNKN
jgi:KRAB domain-containing zinc finger protein